MRVLDLDLDLFVDAIAHWQAPGNRLPSDQYSPWSESQVRDFLEKQCGLRNTTPIPGRVVTDHHEAFYFWRELIRAGKLNVKFDVVHADAHADLGLGDAGWVHLMGKHLHRPVGERDDPEVGSSAMGAGNYLAYAAACRWLQSLTYVHHPDGGDDMCSLHFSGYTRTSDEIELKACRPASLEHVSWNELTDDAFGVVSKEPRIPFKRVEAAAYQSNEPFDIMVLSLSPEFTPPESDALVPVIREYMQSI